MTDLKVAPSTVKGEDFVYPVGNREFVIAAVRTARTRLQAMVYELDEIGVALKNDMLPLENAVGWMHDLGALRYVNVDVWQLTPEAVAA